MFVFSFVSIVVFRDMLAYGRIVLLSVLILLLGTLLFGTVVFCSISALEVISSNGLTVSVATVVVGLVRSGNLYLK